jgi:hypothetical protein
VVWNLHLLASCCVFAFYLIKCEEPRLNLLLLLCYITIHNGWDFTDDRSYVFVYRVV